MTADVITQYFGEVGRGRLLTHAEEIELGRRVRRGDKAAKRHLIERNLRLAISIAKRHRNRGVAFEDLIQEASAGLIRAAGKFDPETGNRFSTLATWWIEQAVRRAVANHSRTVRLPAHLWDRIIALRKAENALSVELGRDPSEEEVAGKLDVRVKDIRKLREVSQPEFSMNTPAADTDKGSLEVGELFPDPTTNGEYEHAESGAWRRWLREALRSLPERESRVLRLRFGLDGCGVRTLREVGAELDIAPERARQVEIKALKTIRRGKHSGRLEAALAGLEEAG